MLERIAKIQGIGLLHDINGKAYTLKKATLIYADNGRGKSTLANILRSVATGDNALMSTRRTLDATLSPEVELQFNSGHKVIFKDGIWSEKRPELKIFDATFIESNVYSGSMVSTDHRKNLLEFALGEASVSARYAVDDATQEAKKASGREKQITDQLSGHHPGLQLGDFEKLVPLDEIDAKINEVQLRLTTANNIAAILNKPLPTAIPEPIFDIDALLTVLRTSLENIHQDAESVVREHIKTLGNASAENWLSNGHIYDDGQHCPYCGQDTSGNHLIKAYQTHFNAAYIALKSKVSTLHRSVETHTAQGIIDSFALGVTAAETKVTAWADHITKPMSITFADSDSRQALKELQALALQLCQTKQASPTEAVGTEADESKLKALWQQIIAAMQVSNQTIKEARDVIELFKGELASENIQALQQQIQKLQATKRRYDPAVIDLFNKLTIARDETRAAETAKKTARDALDTLMRETLAKYQKSINALLKDFGASFSIQNMGANFRGGAPRSEYGLLLRGKSLALDGGPPSFSTALSEGDKRTLAFAFFVACTSEDSNLSNHIVVIDDPMCSFDLNRKHQTKTVLKKLYTKAHQLMVLAHDAYFLRDLRDTIHKADTNAPITQLQLSRTTGDYSTLASMDIDKECEADYFKHHRLLNEFSAGQTCDNRTVAKAIRPMLEGYLHRRFPSLIPKYLMFGGVVAHIRDATSPSPLIHAASLVDILNEINDYAGQFHHDTNPGGADIVSVVDSELKTYTDKALEVVHRGVWPTP
jgi:wobble nucleotide-excising tRNase